MIIIEQRDHSGLAVSHTQICDGVRLVARQEAERDADIMPHWGTAVTGGSLWHGRPAIDNLLTPVHGSILICYAEER